MAEGSPRARVSPSPPSPSLRDPSPHGAANDAGAASALHEPALHTQPMSPTLSPSTESTGTPATPFAPPSPRNSSLWFEASAAGALHATDAQHAFVTAALDASKHSDHAASLAHPPTVPAEAPASAKSGPTALPAASEQMQIDAAAQPAPQHAAAGQREASQQQDRTQQQLKLTHIIADERQPNSSQPLASSASPASTQSAAARSEPPAPHSNGSNSAPHAQISTSSTSTASARPAAPADASQPAPRPPSASAQPGSAAPAAASASGPKPAGARGPHASFFEELASRVKSFKQGQQASTSSAAPIASAASSSQAAAPAAPASLDLRCHCLVVDEALLSAQDRSEQYEQAMGLAHDPSALLNQVRAWLAPTGVAQDVSIAYVPKRPQAQRLHINFASFTALARALETTPFLVRCGTASSVAGAPQSQWSQHHKACGETDRSRLPELLQFTCLPTVARQHDQLEPDARALLAKMELPYTSFWVKQDVNRRDLPRDPSSPELPMRLVLNVLPRCIGNLAADIERLHHRFDLWGGKLRAQAPNEPSLKRCNQCEQLGHDGGACAMYGGFALRILFKTPLPWSAMQQVRQQAQASRAYLGSSFQEQQPSRRLTLLFDVDQQDASSMHALLERLVPVLAQLQPSMEQPARSVNTRQRNQECRQCGSMERPHACPFMPAFGGFGSSLARSAAAAAGADHQAAAPLAPSDKMCRAWYRAKRCTRVNCPFEHPEEHEPVQLCHDFRLGRCSRPNCRYAHVEPAKSRQPARREGSSAAGGSSAPAAPGDDSREPIATASKGREPEQPHPAAPKGRQAEQPVGQQPKPQRRLPGSATPTDMELDAPSDVNGASPAAAAAASSAAANSAEATSSAAAGDAAASSTSAAASAATAKPSGSQPAPSPSRKRKDRQVAAGSGGAATASGVPSLVRTGNRFATLDGGTDSESEETRRPPSQRPRPALFQQGLTVPTSSLSFLGTRSPSLSLMGAAPAASASAAAAAAPSAARTASPAKPRGRPPKAKASAEQGDEAAAAVVASFTPVRSPSKTRK